MSTVSLPLLSGSVISLNASSLQGPTGPQGPPGPTGPPGPPSSIGFTLTTVETFSGVWPIALANGGTAWRAMCNVSGRMPCIGLSTGSVLSGSTLNVIDRGLISGGLWAPFTWGQQMFVGKSGVLVTYALGSGAVSVSGFLVPVGNYFTSGDVVQPIGYVIGKSLMLMQVAAEIPTMLGQITAGSIASGQIGPLHIVSGYQLVAMS